MLRIGVFRGLIGLICLGLLLAACGAEQSTSPTPDQDALDAADQVVEMTTRDMSFTPGNITASPGETVAIRISNPDSIKHDFTIDDIDGESFHVELQPRQEVTFTITMPDDPGEWRFYCSVPGHEALGMAGMIVVR